MTYKGIAEWLAITLTLSTDTVTGTSGNDTINAPLAVNVSTGVATEETFTSFDNIDGGAGTDTLNIFAAGVYTATTAATVKNVENVVVNADNAVTLDASNYSGLQNLTVAQAGGNVTLTTKGNATSVSVKTSSGTIGVTDSATTDTLATVSIDGNTGAATITSDALTSLTVANTNQNAIVSAAAGTRALGVTVNNVTGGTIRDDNATSVTVTGTGAASSGFTLQTDAATSIAFAGDKTISVTLADTGSNSAVVSSITSTNTAGVTISSALGNAVSFTGGSGKDTVTVGVTTKTIDMGAGDDVVNVTGALGSGGALKGGDGVDTLKMNAATAQALSSTPTFAGQVDGFEKLHISGNVPTGSSVMVNMSNLDNIDYAIVDGTSPATGTSEVQTLTVSGGADANGGVLKVGGVDVTIPSNATPAQVATAIMGQSAAIMVANPNISGISLSGNQITFTYLNTAGNVPNISVAQNGSGVTFGSVTTTTAGVAEVAEQQTIQVTAAPTATGLVTVGVLSTPVQFTVTAGQTKDQVAAAMQAALAGAGIANVDNVSVSGDTVTITYAKAAGNAVVASFTDSGSTGVTVNATDNAVAYVSPVAEVQTVTVNSGTDADGGEIVVNGARIALAGGLSNDQVGTAIAGALLQIQAADPNVASIGYNTATDTLTITYTTAAGDVPVAVLSDNSTTGVTATVTEDVPGVAGAAAGQFTLTNMANNGTLELRGAINGASSVVMANATGTNDVFNIKLNGASYIVNNAALTVAGVETINIEATDSNSTADPALQSQIRLAAAAATKVVVTGNHGIDFTTSNLSSLVELDASGVNSTLSTGAGTAAAVWFASQVTNKNVTVKTGNGDDWISLWSITDNTKGGTVSTGAGDDQVIGSAGSDTINLGDGNDLVYSSGKSDTITLGAGKDTYWLWNTSDSTIAQRDVIADFQANTVGQGTGGAPTAAGAVAALSARNGDVIDLSNFGVSGVQVGVFGNAANATTFVANGALDTNSGFANIALDSSTGYLYIDVDDDGVTDSVIELAGVTTITTAAFVI